MTYASWIRGSLVSVVLAVRPWEELDALVRMLLLLQTTRTTTDVVGWHAVTVSSYWITVICGRRGKDDGRRRRFKGSHCLRSSRSDRTIVASHCLFNAQNHSVCIQQGSAMGS